MSIVSIRAALETALAGMTPALATAYENSPYTPVNGIPYQRAYMVFADPDNRAYGPDYTEQGYMQISLFYPLQTGSAAANARAQLLRTTFKRGTDFTSGGITTTIALTPSVSPAFNDGDRYVLPVKIRFFAQITT